MVKPRACIQRDTISSMLEKHRKFLETMIPLSTDVKSMEGASRTRQSIHKPTRCGKGL